MSGVKKKVLFLITKANWGGAQQYVYDLATKLPTEQFAVTVALGGDGGLREKLETADIKVRSIEGLQRDLSIFKELTALKHLSQIIKEERPEIIHVNSSKAGGLGALAGRLNSVPKIIYTAHGWAFNEDRGFLARFLIWLFHYLTIILSHRTIAVSEGMKKQMNWPGATKKMVVIHPGRLVEGFKTKAKARADLSVRFPDADMPERDIWLGTIAELHPIKRLDVAIKSVAKLVKIYPNLCYIIIGEGEERERLTKLIAEQNLTKRVFLTGRIAEAARLLPAFDIFILPSKSESFGYVLIEAGLAGVPAIATAVGGITDFMTNEENGLLIPPNNQTALTEAIKQLLDNPNTAIQLAEKHNLVAKSFTPEKMVKETLAEYLK